jgi:5-hydroxyisourate hydrolase
MPGISIHVVDISRGIVARGMRAELWSGCEGAQFARLVEGEIADSGLLVHAGLDRTFAAGRYRAVFHVGAYYRGCGIEAGADPFLEIVNFDFGMAVPEQHVHLPFKCTPWGYSCFRGGA